MRLGVFGIWFWVCGWCFVFVVGLVGLVGFGLVFWVYLFWIWCFDVFVGGLVWCLGVVGFDAICVWDWFVVTRVGLIC